MVTVTDRQAELAAYAIRDVLSRRRLGGQPVPSGLSDAYAALTAGSDDGTQSCSAAGESAYGDEIIDSAEAAQLLGVSQRRVVRIGADLDGWRVGRCWVFHRRNVIEYAEAKSNR